MTVSSAPEADAPGDAGEGGRVRIPPPDDRLSVGAGAMLALIAGAMAALMFAGHRDGHWWGDDWALYIRQAQGLLDLDPGRVASENEFTIGQSLGPAFSPPLYPWGFPLLLAPFVAVVGPDVDRLTIVPVLSAIVFSCCWFDLVRRRLGLVAGFVAMAAVPLSPLLLGWTELIQSEWPFLAVTGVALVGLDRLVMTGRLVGPTVALGPLVLLGVGAAASFSVRREGIGTIAAIGVAQLVAAGPALVDRSWRGADRQAAAVRLAVPHLVAFATVAAVQLAMPSTLVPSYRGTSVANTWRFAGEHAEHLAEVIGVKRPTDEHAIVLGSRWLGTGTIVALGALAVIGLVAAMTRWRRRDAHLAAHAIVAFVIGGSFRVAINRYVCTVAPILLLLALLALAALVRRIGRGQPIGTRLATVLPIGVLAALVAGNLVSATSRLDLAAEYEADGRVEWGPTHPDAVEMFEAVRRLSDPDDVVAAPKARAMVLGTGRLSVQVDRDRPIPHDLAPALVVVEISAASADDIIAAARHDGYELVWSNTRFAILRPAARSGDPVSR